MADIETVTRFKASDGSLFGTLEGAKEYNFKLRVRDLVEQHLNRATTAGLRSLTPEAETELADIVRSVVAVFVAEATAPVVEAPETTTEPAE